LNPRQQEIPMRPSWTGHLRLSLVSCPIGLSPATTETERIRFNQINPATGNRIALKPTDAETGDAVDRGEIVKGYQYEKGQYVTLSKEELDEVQIEASRILDLTTFVDRASIDPLYVESPYFIYPEKGGIEAYRVVAKAMAAERKAAIGSIVLSTREHPVMVEPRGPGLVMFLLRMADEVRADEFDLPDTKIDPQMIDMASMIMKRAAGKFEPSAFRDRYQDALRELIEAKIKGLPRQKRAPVREPSNVVDLMAVLRKSLGESVKRGSGKKAAKDSRQGNLLLPIKGTGGRAKDEKRQTACRRKRA
jgi:DNA end-binding protein Ku